MFILINFTFYFDTNFIIICYESWSLEFVQHYPKIWFLKTWKEKHHDAVHYRNCKQSIAKRISLRLSVHCESYRKIWLRYNYYLLPDLWVDRLHFHWMLICGHNARLFASLMAVLSFLKNNDYLAGFKSEIDLASCRLQ